MCIGVSVGNRAIRVVCLTESRLRTGCCIRAAIHRARHITRGRQTEAFVEARDAETLREGTTDRNLRDRRELDANLRREVRLARRLIVVAARDAELERFRSEEVREGEE